MRLSDGEPIGLALRRFKKLVAWKGNRWEQRRHVAFVPETQLRRARKFKKRFKARLATLLSQKEGMQPVASLKEASVKFWQRTGKP